MELEVGLVSIHHTIKPRQKLFGAVVRVKDNGNAVRGSDGADVVSGGGGSRNRGGLIFVVNALPRLSVVDWRPVDDGTSPFRRSRQHHLAMSGG